MTATLSEAEASLLLARARSGDRTALDALVVAYRPIVYRYCFARLGNREAAEDVTQETLLSLLETLPRCREDERPFAAHAIGVASAKIGEAWRRSTQWRECAVDTLAGAVDPALEPDARAVVSEELRHAMTLLGRLPGVQREIVLLRLVGLSADEVAAVFDMTPGAVRVAQHRALTKMRHALAMEAS